VAGLTITLSTKILNLNVVFVWALWPDSGRHTYLSANGGGAGYPFFLNSRVEQHKVNYWTPAQPDE
jgi:hypothetical protein